MFGRNNSSQVTATWAMFAAILFAGGTTLLYGQPDPATSKPTTQPAKASEAADQSAKDAKAGGTERKPSRRGDPDPPTDPSYSDILKELREESRGVVTPPPTPPNNGGTPRTRIVAESMSQNAVTHPMAKLLPDGSRIVDRPGRLTVEGDYFTFSFESRGQGAPEAPMRLLPNRLLEDMEITSERGQKLVVFVVSGEVTEYHGVNYLLVQKLLTRPNLGNFK